MATVAELIGQRFARLTVVRRIGSDNGKALWECLCDCGKTTSTTTGSLRKGNTRSCGCLKLQVTGDVHRTHGMSRSSEYRIWCLMRSRCGNPDNQDYKDYGGRGIEVCQRWRESFVAFFADMGPKPFPRAEIDRIDNNGNYEPGNCRWTDRKTQTRNKRNNRIVEYKGEARCIAAWSDLTGISQRALSKRLHRGCSLDRVFSQTRLHRFD